MLKQKVIYISGLGDSYDSFRSFGMKLWRVFGVNAVLMPMTWYDKKPLNNKLKFIERAVKEAENKGQAVTLVGESAGATTALIAASKFKNISKVVTLCGVAQPHTPIANSLRKKAPALDEAVKTLNNLKIEKHIQIISIKALVDSTVNARYSVADNSEVRTLWSIGHFTTISLALTVLAPYFAKLTK